MIPEATKGLSTEAMSEISKAKDNSFVLLYFNFQGVVDTLRAILVMYAEKYTFVHPEDVGGWENLKPKTPFGHMPVLYETSPKGETIELAEKTVLEFYLAKKFSLLGSNDWEEQLVRSYTSSSQALFDKFVRTVVNTSEDQRAQMKLFIEKFVPEWIESHEKALKANGSNGHYIGNKMSIADLKTGTILENLIRITGDKLINKEKTPGIMALHEQIEGDPKYAAWKASPQWKAYVEASQKRFKASPA